MFENIVVATDGSSSAKRAVETAAKLAASCGAKLIMVHAVLPYVLLKEVESSPKFNDLPQEARDEIKQIHDTISRLELRAWEPAPRSATDFIGNAVLDEAEGIAQANGSADISRVLVYGNAAENVVEVARKSGADLIVIGTRGLSDFKGLMLGSVSHKVMQLGECSCLIVK